MNSRFYTISNLMVNRFFVGDFMPHNARYIFFLLLTACLCAGCSRIERPTNLIESPVLHWEHLPETNANKSGTFTMMEETELDAKDGFRIQIKLHLKDYENNFRFGLIFGGEKQRRYVFEITPHESYSLAQVHDKQVTRLIRPRKFPAITGVVQTEKQTVTTFAVERIQDSLFIYREGVLIDKLRLPYYPGNLVGYTMDNKGTVIIEEFTVTRLTRETTWKSSTHNEYDFIDTTP